MPGHPRNQWRLSARSGAGEVFGLEWGRVAGRRAWGTSDFQNFQKSKVKPADISSCAWSWRWQQSYSWDLKYVEKSVECRWYMVISVISIFNRDLKIFLCSNQPSTPWFPHQEEGIITVEKRSGWKLARFEVPHGSWWLPLINHESHHRKHWKTS